MDFQNFIRRVALASNIRTMVELSEVTGIRYSTIARWMNKKSRIEPRMKTLMRFKLALEKMDSNEQITSLLQELDKTFSEYHGQSDAECA